MKKILQEKKYRILLAIICFIGMFSIPSEISELLMKIGIKNEMVISLLSLFVFAILLFLMFLPELVDEIKIFKNDFKKCLDNGFKYWLIGLIIMIVSNLIINLIIFKGEIAANEELNRAQILNSPFFYTFISAVLLGPIIEEIVFRKSLEHIYKNKYFYVITSALLFGFAHTIVDLSNPLNLLYIIPYGALGASFAIMNIKTKTIFTSLMMHMFHNLLTCILILLVL